MEVRTVLDAPAVLAVRTAPANGHAAVGAYLGAGRRDEDAPGAADVVATVIPWLDPLGRVVAQVDDHALTLTVDVPGLDATAASAALAEVLGRLADLDADRDHALLALARSDAAARLRGAAGRPALAAGLVRRWCYRDDPWAGGERPDAGTRLAGLSAVTPEAVVGFVRDRLRPRRLVVAICPSRTAWAGEPADLGGLAEAWDGVDDGPPPAVVAAEPRSYRREADTPGASTTVAWGLAAVGREDPAYRAAALTAAALAAPDGPLLDDLRRRRGLVYQLRARVVPRPGSGEFLVEGQARPGHGGPVLDAITDAWDALARRAPDPAFVAALAERQTIRIAGLLGTAGGRVADVLSARLHRLPADHHTTLADGLARLRGDDLTSFAAAVEPAPCAIAL